MPLWQNILKTCKVQGNGNEILQNSSYCNRIHSYLWAYIGILIFVYEQKISCIGVQCASWLHVCLSSCKVGVSGSAFKCYLDQYIIKLTSLLLRYLSLRFLIEPTRIGHKYREWNASKYWFIKRLYYQKLFQYSDIILKGN